jgi:hypothetical protein
MELPTSGNVSIGARAFQGAGMFMQNIDTNDVQDFFKRINNIDAYAFMNTRYGWTNGIYLYDNIQTIGEGAFNTLRTSNLHVEIGSAEAPFNNATNRFIAGTSTTFQNTATVTSLTIYTNDDHNDWNNNLLVNRLGINITATYPI